MIRSWLRQWLGITKTEARVVLLQGDVDGLKQIISDLGKKHAEVNAIILEVRQLREMLTDPKSKVIVAKTTHQFRALMEQDL